MADYSLVIGSKFSPFSYLELLQPALMATQAHQDLENQYGELDAKASVWDKLANGQTDPNTYKMYKAFADDLRHQSAILAREGLNATSRRNMLNMRARYSKEIIPIETAYKRRRELADEQRKMIAQNPSMLYQRDARTLSLDALINNPELDYGQSYSGAMITQQVATAAANIAKEARDSEEGKRKLRQLLPYQYELIQQNGFSREAVMKAILNDDNANSILTGLVENAINTSGVLNWGDSKTIARAYDYARQGLYNAIGQTTYTQVTDQAGLAKLQADLQDRNTKKAEERAIARAKKEKEDNLLLNIANRTESNFRTSGDYENTAKLLEGLRAGQGSLKASYYGKNGKANILRVKEDWDKLNARLAEELKIHGENPEGLEKVQAEAIRLRKEKILKSFANEMSSHDLNSSLRADVNRMLKGQLPENKNWRNSLELAFRQADKKSFYGKDLTEATQSIINREKQAYMAQQGVSDIINTETYNALKTIGYSGSAGKNRRFDEEFNDLLNAQAQRLTIYSTAMSEYAHPSTIISNRLGQLNREDKLSGKLYEYKAGKKGKALSYGDLDLNDEKVAQNITDILYDPAHPTSIVLQIGSGSNTRRVLADPSIIDDKLAGLLSVSAANSANYDSREAAILTTAALSNALNNYNKTKSKSGKED